MKVFRIDEPVTISYCYTSSNEAAVHIADANVFTAAPLSVKP